MLAMWAERTFARGLIALAFATAAAFAPGPLVAASTDANEAVRVTVRMLDYRFVPDHLSFRRGVLYRLSLINQGKEIHEFTAPSFIAAIDLKNPDALGPYTNQFAVDPGKQKDVYFIARQPGRYGLTCADHDWAGMTGEIVVTP